MSVIDDYFAWLKNISFMEDINDNVARISLPFLNRNNDYTEIYAVKRSENEYLLTDNGETCNELELSGFDFSGKRASSLINMVNSHGVSLNSNNEMYVIADINDMPQKKHMLVQCLIKVNDMFASKMPMQKPLFIDEIAAFFDAHSIRYTPNISIIGKSKLPCQFDFAIPKSAGAPERLVRGINNLDNNSAKLLIFNWEDTRLSRNNESR